MLRELDAYTELSFHTGVVCTPKKGAMQSVNNHSFYPSNAVCLGLCDEEGRREGASGSFPFQGFPQWCLIHELYVVVFLVRGSMSGMTYVTMLVTSLS